MDKLNAQATILVVEDEEPIRRLIVATLSKDGHLVIEAHDPFEAAAMMGAGLFDVDVLIADIVMPNMTGDVFAAEMRAMLPKIKIIFATGSNIDDLKKKPTFDALLQKPYSAEALREAVRSVLGERDSGRK